MLNYTIKLPIFKKNLFMNKQSNIWVMNHWNRKVNEWPKSIGIRNVFKNFNFMRKEKKILDDF